VGASERSEGETEGSTERQTGEHGLLSVVGREEKWGLRGLQVTRAYEEEKSCWGTKKRVEQQLGQIPHFARLLFVRLQQR
jgi:hypothetical protein